ncbi:MAG: hypothetical protein NTW87_22000 [Planctomycetota bacterium]|nr:hypothetical protein [Planctomycetota bacterium]
MSDQEAPHKPLFLSSRPSAAFVPHLLTHFDAELLSAVVRINGAKLGVWNIPAPFSEDDRYEPYRENAPLSAWTLALNQQELLNLSTTVSGLIFGNETMIVNSSADESVLAECERQCGEQGYEDLPDFAAVLAKINWALIPVDQEHERALFVASEEKVDYVHLLHAWCHQHGRTVSTIAFDGDKVLLQHHPAPPEARQQAAVEHGYQLLGKMAHFGISPQEAIEHLSRVVGTMPKA